jgi:hypothetical protein
MAEVVIWPLAMLARGGSVEWVAVEQSSALPARIEAALMDRLREVGWHTSEAWTLDAVDYRAASHRKRRLMAAYRGGRPFVDLKPAQPFPTTTSPSASAGPRDAATSRAATDPSTRPPDGPKAAVLAARTCREHA